MTSEQTTGQLIVTEPALQMALVLAGVLLLWYEIHSIRKSLRTADPASDRGTAISFCNGLIAVRAKSLAGGILLVQLGLCLLLVSTGLLSGAAALNLFAILVFGALIPAIVYFMIWGTPTAIFRLLLSSRPLPPANTA